MSRDFIGALLQLNAEKGVPREQLVRTVEDAIQSAYRRVAPGYEDVYVNLDTETGEMRIYRARLVVSEVEDDTTQWSIAKAQEHDPQARLGDLVEYEQLEPTLPGQVLFLVQSSDTSGRLWPCRDGRTTGARRSGRPGQRSQ